MRSATRGVNELWFEDDNDDHYGSNGNVDEFLLVYLIFDDKFWDWVRVSASACLDMPGRFSSQMNCGRCNKSKLTEWILGVRMNKCAK